MTRRSAMGFGHGLSGALLAAAVLGGIATIVSANELPVPPGRVMETPAADTTAKEKVASAPVIGRAISNVPNPAAGLETDGLHQDPRWPQFRKCIEETATPKEFESCLQSAFMIDTTGTAASFGL